MKQTVLILVFFTTFISCRKDNVIPVTVCENILCTDKNYDLYSTNSFDFVKMHLVGQSTTGPNFDYQGQYIYHEPVFNPKDLFEIAYVKIPTSLVQNENEIWKFNFCTGKATKIADNYFYNLDWGSNGWLIYTASDLKIRKIRDNGDSLTVLSTQSGYNRSGKWNPSGTLYWNSRDLYPQVENINGDIVFISGEYIKIIDWIDDKTLLFQYSNGVGYYSLDIETNAIISLNTNLVPVTGETIYDGKRNVCYATVYLGSGNDDYFLKFDLNGSNSVDTLYKLYDSYRYIKGDIGDNRIITGLRRQHWKDSTADTRYSRSNIILLDLESLKERMVNLPE